MVTLSQPDMETVQTVKVLVVDDHPIVLSGCRALLAGEDDLNMVEARDAEAAHRLFVAEKPDIVIIDINLPDVSGFELARRILSNDPDARIIMFSMNDDPMFAAQAIECGAKGYVSKNGDPVDLLAAIRDVQNGGVALPGDIAVRVALLRFGRQDQAGTRLSPRETEILRLLAKGRSMSEIGDLLNISYKTVATTCSALRTRLNARTPMELVRIAVEQKFV